MKKYVVSLGTVLLAWGLSSSVGATTLKLSADLLSQSQLPKGWVTASTESLVPGCNTSSLGAAPTAQSSDAFDFGTVEGFPQINEDLASYANVGASFNVLVSALKGCADITGTKKGVQYTVTIGPVAFSHYGDQSAAYTISVKGSGISQTAYFLAVRKGDLLLQLTEVYKATASRNSFESLAATAVGKM